MSYKQGRYLLQTIKTEGRCVQITAEKISGKQFALGDAPILDVTKYYLSPAKIIYTKT